MSTPEREFPWYEYTMRKGMTGGGWILPVNHRGDEVTFIDHRGMIAEWDSPPSEFTNGVWSFGQLSDDLFWIWKNNPAKLTLLKKNPHLVQHEDFGYSFTSLRGITRISEEAFLVCSYRGAFLFRPEEKEWRPLNSAPPVF